MQRFIRRGLLSVVAAGVLVVAGPAVAASSSCRIFPVKDTSCTTGLVAANRSKHFLYFSVSPAVNYSIRDTETRKVVASGNSGFTVKRKTIFGLYGNGYELTIHNPIGGAGYLSNK